MSSASIKRHNHRVFPCDFSRKIELINFLLQNNSDTDVAIISKETINNFKDITPNENVKILTDNQLNETSKTFEMLIHFDLPNEPQEYFNRIKHANMFSFVLLDPSEQKMLYPIETLLGRALVNEVVKGFETTQALEEEKAKIRKKKRDKRYQKEAEEKKALKEAKKVVVKPKRNVRKIVKKEEE